ncbi:hypothetical protein DVH24_000239 [Malus domestica]|uniref:Uncharacterized protein n=1 Tax=Malus domestica TaxID=3750 RepID=A0A498IZD7_MALDO|nr:hypothetical protein DVH24_000239 [Malus domestica]
MHPLFSFSFSSTWVWPYSVSLSIRFASILFLHIQRLYRNLGVHTTTFRLCVGLGTVVSNSTYFLPGFLPLMVDDRFWPGKRVLNRSNHFT